jgi:riboflavin kinase/FMN adenylyltransferase
MTPDAAFGHDRRGTPEAVRALGDLDGFDLVVVPTFALDGRSVRSSDVRSAIATGELETAERLLGRPYAVVGEAGADGLLRFDMPVASPPAGSYQVSVKDEPASLLVDNSGTMRLVPANASSRGTRLSIEFAEAVSA